jgi:hypothetical protein
VVAAAVPLCSEAVLEAARRGLLKYQFVHGNGFITPGGAEENAALVALLGLREGVCVRLCCKPAHMPAGVSSGVSSVLPCVDLRACAADVRRVCMPWSESDRRCAWPVRSPPLVFLLVLLLARVG